MDEAIPLASELSTGNIKTIDWNKGMSYTIESIETRDGETHYPTPVPNPWLYPFVAILPLLGFALPWGLVRAVGWVGAGFVTGSK